LLRFSYFPIFLVDDPSRYPTRLINDHASLRPSFRTTRPFAASWNLRDYRVAISRDRSFAIDLQGEEREGDERSRDRLALQNASIAIKRGAHRGIMSSRESLNADGVADARHAALSW